MKLKDLNRFSLETDIHATGGMTVSVFQLEDKKGIQAGTQRQTNVISLVTDGKNEEDATKNGIDFALEVLEGLKDHAEIVKVGVRELGKEPNGDLFSAVVQVGLFDKSSEGADLIKKKGFGFGKNKNMKKAQQEAIESALRLMGEK